MQLHQEVPSQAGLFKIVLVRGFSLRLRFAEGVNVPRNDPLLSALVEALAPKVAGATGLTREVFVASGRRIVPLLVAVFHSVSGVFALDGVGLSRKSGSKDGESNSVEMHR